MIIEIITRQNNHQWGGDMTVLNSLNDSFKKIGLDSSIVKNFENVNSSTIYVATNTCLDIRPLHQKFLSVGAKYFLIPFHEDFKKYFVASIVAFQTVLKIMEELTRKHDSSLLVELEKYPEILHYGNVAVPNNAIANRHAIEYSSAVFPSSNKEKVTVLRDSPYANCKKIYFPTAVNPEFFNEGENFCAEYGLEPGYMIQVGRLETRKNQLLTILASRDIPRALVFIATKGYQPKYTEALIEAAIKFRRYPTIIISEDLSDSDLGMVKIIKMKNNQKLSWGMLASAYKNSCVNVHPAFYELPGLTYLESISLGVKTICSKYASIDEYLVKTNEFNGVYFIDPTNIKEIRMALLEAVYSTSCFNASVINVTPLDYANQVIKSIIKYN